MKTKKEYPATHSMSTTWYAVDTEGNVAIIDYNANGPIPYDIPTDTGFEDVLFTQMKVVNDSFPPQLDYTEEQALLLLENAQSIKNDTKLFSLINCVVQIDTNKEDRFLSIINSIHLSDSNDTILAISKKHGIYYVDICEEDTGIDILIDEKILINYYPLHFDTNEFLSDGRWNFSFKAKEIPFYVYCQPYWTSQLIERVAVPKHPMRIEQITNNTSKILYLPFRFSERKLFQIAEFYKSKLLDKNVTIDGDDGYLALPLTNGGSAFFRNNKDQIDYIPIDEAFDNHNVVINDLSIEYQINGKRGYYKSEDDESFYRIGSINSVKVSKNDVIEIFSPHLKND